MAINLSESNEFNDKNQELFARRVIIRDEISLLKSSAPSRKSKLRQHQSSVEVKARELEDIDSEIIRLNYGLVLSYVKKFTSNSNMDDSKDFEMAAVLGLVRAISTYDPTRGAKFSTWAFKPIQRECLKAVRDADYNHLNAGDFEKRPEIERAVKELRDENDEKMPSFEEVAKLANTSSETVKRVLMSGRHESIYRPVDEDEKTYLGDLIVDSSSSVEDEIISNQEALDLNSFGLNVLDEREMFVIGRRFGLDSEPPQKLSAIGRMLGLSREAVRQVEAKALSKLNHPVVLRKLMRHGR